MKNKTFKVSADIRLRHGVLWEWMQDNGLSIRAMSRLSGISYATLLSYVNMTTIPRSTEIINKLENITKIPFDDMFPSDYIRAVKEGNGKSKRFTVTQDVDTSKLITTGQSTLSLDTPEQYKARDDDRAMLKKALGELPPKWAQVVTLYYGLDSGEPLTYSEIGAIMSLSTQRVRQICLHAMRDLKKILTHDLMLIEKDNKGVRLDYRDVFLGQP